jgi:PTS system nitrogen regulatory IIA component
LNSVRVAGLLSVAENRALSMPTKKQNPADLHENAESLREKAMVDLAELINAKAIIHRIRGGQKNAVLLEMAERAAEVYGVDLSETYESTLERERLGGTGVGDGVAIPHARLKGLLAPTAVLAILDPAVDFDAPDGRLADIVVLLLSPQDAGADHLKALASISRLLRRQEIRDGLRAARTAAAIHAVTREYTTFDVS